MRFDPNDLVAKAVRQIDVVAGTVDTFGHFGFFVSPRQQDDESEGFWLMENRQGKSGVRGKIELKWSI